jgi:hypothetical protein
MSIDSTRPIPQGPRPEWDLPEILDVEIRRVRYDPPKLRNFESALAGYKEAVEFRVRTSGPIPARALGPALFVGEVQVVESQEVETNLYRFLAFDFERLESGAANIWGWINDPVELRQRTRFRYEERR